MAVLYQIGMVFLTVIGIALAVSPVVAGICWFSDLSVKRDWPGWIAVVGMILIMAFGTAVLTVAAMHLFH